MKILKNDKRYIGAPLDDYILNVGLESTKSMFSDNIRELNVNQTDVFNDERNKCDDYIFYGKLELLDNNNIKPYIELGFIGGYEVMYGIEIDEINDGAIIINDISLFNVGDKIIYYDNLLGKEKITKIVHYENYDNKYKLFLDLLNVKKGDIITPSQITIDRYYKSLTYDFKIFKSGFSINIFGDSIYQFISNKNINLNLNGFLGTPITKIHYKLNRKNSNNNVDGFRFKKIYKSSILNIDDEQVSFYTNNPNKIDRILFDLNEFEESKIFDYILLDGNQESKIYHEVLIREIGETIEESFSNIIEPPNYAVYFMDGDVFYKVIKDKSDVNIDDDYDFPFINNLHYKFDTIIYIVDDRSVEIPEDVENITEQLEDDYKSKTLINSNRERLC